MNYVWFVRTGNLFVPVRSGAIVISLILFAWMIKGSMNILEDDVIFPFLIFRVSVYVGFCIRCYNMLAFKLS